MGNKGENISEPAAKKLRFGLLQVMGIVALAVIVTDLIRELPSSRKPILNKVGSGRSVSRKRN